jgi:hypothetical protein
MLDQEISESWEALRVKASADSAAAEHEARTSRHVFKDSTQAPNVNIAFFPFAINHTVHSYVLNL